MAKILLLIEKANVTQMLPKKVRYLSSITIFLKKITMKKAIMIPPHAWHKDFWTKKHKKTHTFFCVGTIKYFLNLSFYLGGLRIL